MQFIARPHRDRPAHLIAAEADAAAGWDGIAFGQKPHGHRGGVPAARYQATEDRMTRGFLVEVEILRVEFPGEGDDVVLLDPQPLRRLDDLADGKVFEE